MKLRKTKIAAAAMAAITAISASQAITASAFNYTPVPQRTCETYSYVNNITTYNSGTFQANTKWSSYSWASRVETWGPTCKGGYQDGSYSGISHGAQITDGKAFARKMARGVYNTTTYMELKERSGYCAFKYLPRIGDQVTLKYGSTEKTIFITNVSTTNVYACEVDESGYIKYNNYYSFTPSTNKFNRGGKAWAFQYVARPIKFGDVNGDSYVSLSGDAFACGNKTFNCGADGSEISYLYNYGCRSGEQYNWLCSAGDMNGDWQFDARDYKIFCDRMRDPDNITNISHDGCMPNYSYVVLPW